MASGWVATIEAGGVIAPATASWTARWWVAEGDLWRRPSDEASLRTRLVDDMGVVESAVRVASGDVTSTVRAFVPAGGAGAAIGVDVVNGTPIPVAVAVVVGPVRSAEVRDDALLIDGVSVVRFARRPSRWGGAATLEELAVIVTPDREPSGTIDFGPGGGWVEVVSPLPHTATLELVIGTDLGGGSYPVPPSAEQVAAGWSNHAERGARLDPADALAAAMLRRGRGLLAGVALEESTPIDVVAEVGRAAVRLGWDDRATTAAGLLAVAQDRRGFVGDADVTVSAIDVWAGRWRLGATVDEMEALVVPMASAATALLRGGGVLRRGSPAYGDPSGALVRAAAVADSLDQPDLAAGLRRVADRAVRVATGDGSPLGPWGVAHRNGGDVDVAAVARSVSTAVDAMVRDVDGANVELATGWQPDQAGVATECHGIPTAGGLVSYAVRWHGRRPALLWEVEPWPGRPTFGLSAASIDPSWSVSDREGDALLAEPAGLGTDIVGTVIDVLSGPASLDGPAAGESFG